MLGERRRGIGLAEKQEAACEDQREEHDKSSEVAEHAPAGLGYSASSPHRPPFIKMEAEESRRQASAPKERFWLEIGARCPVRSREALPDSAMVDSVRIRIRAGSFREPVSGRQDNHQKNVTAQGAS